MLKIWVFRFFEDACLYAVISVVKSSEQTSFTAGVLTRAHRLLFHLMSHRLTKPQPFHATTQESKWNPDCVFRRLQLEKKTSPILPPLWLP